MCFRLILWRVVFLVYAVVNTSYGKDARRVSSHPGTPSRAYFSLDDYFALELASPERHEYWYGAILCMSGGTDEHGVITSNIHGELFSRLKGTNCWARTENTAVKNPLPPRLDWPLFVYPDASVVCEPRRRFQNRRHR